MIVSRNDVEDLLLRMEMCCSGVYYNGFFLHKMARFDLYKMLLQ